MNTNHCVYVIANTVNDKVYVGQTTKGFPKRWERHRNSAKTFEYDSYFMRAIRAHGADKFYCAAQLHVGANLLQRHNLKIEDALNNLERGLIACLESWKPEKGYNSTMGGDGITMTPEIRAKISVALTGIKRSPETCAKLSASHTGQTAWNKGTPRDPETRAKISAANRGRIQSPEERAKRSAWQKGRVLSPEHRANISAAHTGMTASLKTRAKLSATRTGMRASLKTRAKMSAAKMGVPLSPEHRANMSAGKTKYYSDLRQAKSGLAPQGE